MLAWFDAVKMESMSCLDNDQRKIHLSTTNEQSVFMFTVNNLCLVNS